MKRLAVLGASGHGKVVADLAELLGFTVQFFDRAWSERQAIAKWPVLGSECMLLDRALEFDGVVVAIGNNQVRAERFLELDAKGARLATLVHSSAQISRYAALGIGTVIFANAVINVDAFIGRGVIINTASTVDHDCHLSDFVHISPGVHLAGNVTVGCRSWVGIGASVRQGVTIGEDVVVGAGAVVVSDIPSGSCVVGVPAKPISLR
ncbi:Trimeric LpxA-like family protein [Alcanivorax sp. S71-1-4]|uniref:acetyltransferase n=1 Tax=Alcanivorax sp. S71-1-4 TaxID=1177159 RepID=UPI001357651B|nr:acetyltransferase [Alcanivorax sp. S71-1-4]KAF0809839.1 Trimeric LpxA-like family protein [Alcanivorax sp. S71-1-4]